MIENLYKLFYKDYFQGIDYSHLLPRRDGENTARGEQDNKRIISSVNRRLLEANNGTDGKNKRMQWNDAEKQMLVIPRCKRVNCVKELCVCYPGIITGVGLNHEANIEGEFKLGLHLDYTYGMPVIYGSTIKGVLRSAFEDKQYIRSLLQQLKVDADIDDLVADIFEGKERDPENDDAYRRIKAYKNKSIYKRDIFFDAVIVNTDSKGRILVSDYITPHKDELKDPLPIGFIKIAPGSTIEFRFRLETSSVLSNEDKYWLFLQILTDFGVGAKTHVGYGQFCEDMER